MKPAVNTLAPVNGMAIGAKSKNLQVGQTATTILKSNSGGKVSSLTDLHGNGLRLRVIRIYFKQSFYKKTNELRI